MPGLLAGSGGGKYSTREPKTGEQKVQLSSKTNHFAHLGILFIYAADSAWPVSSAVYMLNKFVKP